MWRHYAEVISLDDTYTTNRFNLPLMQVTEITDISITVNIAWALLKDEREHSYQWVLSRLQKTMEEYQVPLPVVIISDFDTALGNALHNVFPQVATQLCLWHVMKNVAFNVKKKWEGTLDGTLLGQTLGGTGASISEESIHLQQEADAEYMAYQLLEAPERTSLALNVHANHSQYFERQPGPGHSYVDNAGGLLKAWKTCTYARTEELFDESWQRLQREFSNQPDK